MKQVLPSDLEGPYAWTTGSPYISKSKVSFIATSHSRRRIAPPKVATSIITKRRQVCFRKGEKLPSIGFSGPVECRLNSDQLEKESNPVPQVSSSKGKKTEMNISPITSDCIEKGTRELHLHGIDQVFLCTATNSQDRLLKHNLPNSSNAFAQMHC